MARGTRAIGSPPAVPVYTTRVKLVGGPADGRSVELSSLTPKMFVHLDDEGRAHAADAQLAEHGWPPAGSRLYRLVNPAGPEEPTYVAPSI
jgi:hypothetical protein